MAAIVAPTVCRFTVNGHYGVKDVANVLDFVITEVGSPGARATAINDQAGAILDAWDDNLLSLLDNVYVAESVSWVDLDSLSGSTGVRSSTPDNTWPKAGSQSGAGMPAAMAIRVDKETVAVRGQRQGRMYLAGVNESFTDDSAISTVDSSSRGAFNAGLASFFGDASPLEGDVQLVVVHTVDGEFTSFSNVTGLTCNPVLGTQVRRGPLR